MHGRIAVLALVALPLAACGSSATTTAATTHPAAAKVKTTNGKGIGVVLLPDTGDQTRAAAEAKMLGALGVTALVVPGPATAPSDRAAFEQSVHAAQLAIAKLREQNGVDPDRVGLIGEGVGAHIGAVAMGRRPRSVAAAVLADIGGVVVPSPSFAPDRWLRRALGTDVLFQRDTAKRAMTAAEMKRLLLAAPPGTLMEQYKTLDAQAESERDTWMRDHLIAR